MPHFNTYEEARDAYDSATKEDRIVFDYSYPYEHRQDIEQRVGDGAIRFVGDTDPDDWSNPIYPLFSHDNTKVFFGSSYIDIVQGIYQRVDPAPKVGTDLA